MINSFGMRLLKRGLFESDIGFQQIKHLVFGLKIFHDFLLPIGYSFL